MKSNVFAALLLLLFFTACQDSGQGEKNSETVVEESGGKTMEEVLVIHDETMEEMGELMDKLEKVKALDTTDLSEDFLSERKHLIVALEDAEEEMFSWMHQFDPNNTDSIYVQGQFNSVTKMSENLYGSIDSAQSYLRKISTQ